MINRFRNANNVLLTRALFWEETPDPEKSAALYTLSNETRAEKPSLYKLYMQEEDLTEYEFALKYFDGWEHWEVLNQCSWFKPYIDRWRRELKLKMEALTLRAIIDEATSKTSKNRFQANKMLYDRVTLKASPNKRPLPGRPKDHEVDAEVKRLAEIKRQIDEDFERVKITQHE